MLELEELPDCIEETVVAVELRTNFAGLVCFPLTTSSDASEASEEADAEFGEHISTVATLSNLMRVRSTGLLTAVPLFIGLPGAPSGICSFTFVGIVRAQFSQAFARL